MLDVLQELHSMRQGDRSLSQFFTEMKILWDEFKFLCPTPTCSCNVPCTCALSKFINNFKQTEYVICFLKCLNESFYDVRTQILIMDPLPSISKRFALALQQERPPTSSSQESATFAATSNSSSSQGRGNGYQGNNYQWRGHGRGGPRPLMLCTHCNRTNHTVENYYIKHMVSHLVTAP